MLRTFWRWKDTSLKTDLTKAKKIARQPSENGLPLAELGLAAGIL
jgi:hypothetical protein